MNVDQPSLPLFPGRTVQYHVIQPHGPNGETPEEAWKPIRVSVDEIDSIADERIRDALWGQFRLQEKQANWTQFIFVRSDGSYSHAFQVPTKPLGVRFTSRGVEELHDDMNMPLSFPSEEAESLASTIRIKKILSWLRR